MKSWCAAAVVLSLASVCRAAPLACGELLKPLDQSPDLPGTWYLIAMTSDDCMFSTFFNNLLWPSFAMDISAKATPKLYESSYKVNMFGYCQFEAETFLLNNNVAYKTDANNVPTNVQVALLHTGCSDCLVSKGNNRMEALLLFSRRKNVSAAEMREFEAQAECLGWFQPQVLNTDHEYENCKSLDDVNHQLDNAKNDFSNRTNERLNTTLEASAGCIVQTLFSHIGRSLMEQLESLLQ